eukprot:TRINITY_DN41867_c0_g1_i1.p1 TRINITY_DN41867_c0_g1~~TRINITY_DN41867_c0_g1_i1.p1  ORF type:complete len:288 (+),score=71.41 TRINITY_DN41867_c0_g1_i1:17-880(+)
MVKKLRKRAKAIAEAKKAAPAPVAKPKAPKERVLIFSSRGIKSDHRDLMDNLRSMLPHSKKDSKLDCKDRTDVCNEVCEMKNCNKCLFLEGRKMKDLYLWCSNAPEGPSAKMLVQSLHTLDDLRLTGNCLKGSRPLLVFDKGFDDEPCHQVLKELLAQTFQVPNNYHRSKPFIDHVLSFFLIGGRVWVRHYQIKVNTEHDQHKNNAESHELLEIGPRFVLNPLRVFEGSFGGRTLYENDSYISPNEVRAAIRRRRGKKVTNRMGQVERRAKHLERNPRYEEDVDGAF